MDQCDYSNYNERSRLQIVPWFNKKEWEQTYQEVYSDNVESQTIGYTQMCIWKSRYPNLPLGVECTMSILHVKLCDNQSADNYKERDLRLLYSTAVMRFLNHLTVMSNCKDSMYKMAEKHKIPDWLINLRHEVAHGNSVPALYLLRQSSDIIMQWLRENYWEVEANIMEDVVADREEEHENEHKRVRELLELWLKLKLRHWAGLKTIDRIPDEDVRRKAMALAEEEGLGIKQTTEPTSENELKTMESADSFEIVVDGEPVERYTYTHKIKTAFEPLLRKLFAPMKGKSQKRARYQEYLIKYLLEYEGFSPKVDLDQLNEKQVCQMMWLLGQLWKEVLEGLKSYRLLHCLLRALMSHNNQISSAQLWLRLLCQVLAGDPPRPPPSLYSRASSKFLADCLPCDVQPEVLMRQVTLHRLKHQRPLDLRPPSARDSEVLQQHAHRVLENPTRFTAKYMYCLLDFWETTLNTDTKEKLGLLASIYSGERLLSERPSNVYTLASLLDQGLVIHQQDIVEDDHKPPDPYPWKLYSGEADWSKCPLGALPW